MHDHINLGFTHYGTRVNKYENVKAGDFCSTAGCIMLHDAWNFGEPIHKLNGSSYSYGASYDQGSSINLHVSLVLHNDVENGILLILEQNIGQLQRMVLTRQHIWTKIRGMISFSRPKHFT